MTTSTIDVATTLRAVALAELDGEDTTTTWRELASISPRSSDEPWPRPTPRETALDAEYARLARVTLTNRFLVPTNLERERARFLEHWHTGKAHEPSFTYPAPPEYPDAEWRRLITGLDPERALDRLYLALCALTMGEVGAVRRHDPRHITALTNFAYGAPSAHHVARARAIFGEARASPMLRPIDATTVARRLEDALRANGIEGWTIDVTRDMHARLAVSSATRQLRVHRDAAFDEGELDGLLSHEIGTHVTRAHLGARQPLTIFATGLPGYLRTEEGLAVHNELAMTGEVRDLSRFALRVLAAHVALERGFRATFAHCMTVGCGEEAAFSTTLRAKRGFSDVARPGAHLKDTVYLVGYDEVADALTADASGDVRSILYIGKVGLQHLPSVRCALADGWLLPATSLGTISSRPVGNRRGQGS